MARFVSSRHGSEALAPVQVRIGSDTPSGPAIEASPIDTSCYDSSWELRQGLEVAELETLPDDLLPPGASPPNPPDRP